MADDPLLADTWFARNLRSARTGAGMSQRMLGEKMRDTGFPFEQQTIQRIENGKRRASVGEAYALGRLVGVNAAVLVEPPDLTKRRTLLSQLTAQVHNATRDLSAHHAVLDMCRHDLERLISEARAHEGSGLLADEIAGAEQALKIGPGCRSSAPPWPS